jgi:hypothetical protein
MFGEDHDVNLLTQLGAETNFTPSLINFRQLRICWYGARSLTRSRVCSFQFLPGFTSAAFLRSESHGTHEHSLLSRIFLSLLPTWRTRFLYLFPRGTGYPTYNPWHWVLAYQVSWPSRYKLGTDRTETTPPTTLLLLRAICCGYYIAKNVYEVDTL